MAEEMTRADGSGRPAKENSSGHEPADAPRGAAAPKTKSGASERRMMAETIRDLERKNRELLVRIREFELAGLDATNEEIVNDRAPAPNGRRQGESMEESEDRPYGDAFVGQNFFRTSVKFGMHAVFFYAGKLADKIISLYSGALKLDREYVGDFNKSAGLAHARRGRWDKAIPLLERSLAISPHDLDVRMYLARAYGATDQYEQACQHLEAVLEAAPDSARAVRAMGILHSRRQDYEQAVEYLERAAELDPDHAPTHYRLGMAYDNRKLYGQAIESFRKATLLDPRFAKAYQAMGFTYESMGDRKSAIECFKKALELE